MIKTGLIIKLQLLMIILLSGAAFSQQNPPAPAGMHGTILYILTGVAFIVIASLFWYKSNESKARREMADTMDVPDICREAMMGSVKNIKSLLKNNPEKLNEAGGDGRRALHFAMTCSTTDVAEFLISREADLNAKDNQGVSSLHMAVEFNRTDLVKLLLEKGADVNNQDNLGHTPLHYAVDLGLSDLATLLISKGADKEMKDKGGITPMELAGIEGVREAIRLFDLKKIQEKLKSNPQLVLATDIHGDTLLHTAIHHENLEAVELLLTRGASVNAKDKEGNSPLIKTILSSSYSNQAAAIFNKNGGEKNSAKSSSMEIGRLLISKGADVNSANKNLVSPLAIAAARGETELSALLIKSGAKVNTKDNSDAIPLHFAMKNPAKDMIELLLEKGSDVNSKDNKGRTPVDVLKTSGVSENLVNEIMEIINKKAR